MHTVNLNLKSYFGCVSIIQKGVIFYSSLQKPVMLIYCMNKSAAAKLTALQKVSDYFKRATEHYQYTLLTSVKHVFYPIR